MKDKVDSVPLERVESKRTVTCVIIRAGETFLNMTWQPGRWLFLMLTLPAFSTAFAVWAGDNVWTSLGPEGGSIQAMVIDPQNSNTVYAIAGGWIFKSTDQARTWKRVYLYPTSVLVIDPQNTDTLYAGTAGGGILKSEDGGASWSAASSGFPTLPNGAYATVRTLVVDPQNPSTIYAAVNECCPVLPGIFKSTDGAATWNAASFGLPSPALAIALAIDPQNPSVLYAGTGSGIFRSWNGGAYWSAASSGLPISNPGNPSSPYVPVTALAIDPQNTSRIYAARRGVFTATQDSTISISTDGGASWTPRGGLRASVFSLAMDPDDPSTVYAGTDWGVLKSTDGAASWTAANYGLQSDRNGLSIPFLATDPQNPGTLYAATPSPTASAGMFKSTDGGESWNPVNNSGLVATSVNSLVVDPTSSGTLYTRVGGEVFKTGDSGAHWKKAYSAMPTDDGRSTYPAAFVAVGPAAPDTVYIAIGGNGDGGGGVFKSDDGAASWTRFPLPRRGGLSGLAIDPKDSGIIYAWMANNTRPGLFKSWDGAASWSELNSVAPFRGISNLWIDPQNSATLYARTNSGPIPALVKSTDGGGSWTEVTPTMTVFSGDDFQTLNIVVNSLAIDPQNSSIVYAMTNQGVFESTDGAASWSAAEFNFPSDSAGQVRITFLMIAPQNSNLLYATTNKGVFKTTDGGASWTVVNSGLPTLSATLLAIDPQNSNTVYAGTNGAGIFAITFVPGP
jgi:hypothetical protein